MNIRKANNLACPLDGLPLTISEKQLVCSSGHSFDVARQGYVNLLPVQQKRSKHPGDSHEMIEARAAFLNTEIYAPIAGMLNDISFDLIVNNKLEDICILDAGCGEGYYLENLLCYLEQKSIRQNVSFMGLDISKPAILAAAKRSKKMTWLVASNKKPPVLPGTVDIIFCLFGFPVYDRFRTLLKPGGHIVLVEAGVEHLIELRNIIYPVVNKSAPPDLSQAEAAGFSLCHQSDVTYLSKNMSKSQITNLLGMTPHLYRASQEGKQMIHQLDTIDMTVDVIFRVLEST